MNGARTTFMRKGYLLTALAAAVLLAASSGTAWAQTATIDSLTLNAPKVDEGGRATAMLTFTLAASSTSVLAADNVEAQFGFVADDTAVGVSNARQTQATNDSFNGLTTALVTRRSVQTTAVPANGKRTFNVSYSFDLQQDLDAEDGKFKLMAGLVIPSVTNPANKTSDAMYIIDDDETQVYTLSLPTANRGVIQEEAAATIVTLTANPGRTSAATVPNFAVVLRADTLADYTYAAPTGGILATALVANPAGSKEDTPAGTILAKNDKNRENDTISLELLTGTIGNSRELAEPLVIPVVDQHVLPAAGAITAVAMDKVSGGARVTEVEEGGDAVYLTVTVDSGTGATATTDEALTVAIQADPAQAGDYRLTSTTPLTVAEGTGKRSTAAEIKLEALSDAMSAPKISC